MEILLKQVMDQRDFVIFSEILQFTISKVNCKKNDGTFEKIIVL